MIDPACGEGVFLHTAVAHGLPAKNCFGADIDETLVPIWESDPRLRGAGLFHANGLLEHPSLGIKAGAFDFVIGNPPFAGNGLKDLLRLLPPAARKTSKRARSLFEEAPDGVASDQVVADGRLTRQERDPLDQLVRQLSQYMCWRLRDDSDEAADGPANQSKNGSLFDGLGSPERSSRAANDARVAQTIAEWPADRPLDASRPDVRDVIRRLASTAVEVFFTERFVQLAKPGGMIALIVPQSILASDQLAPLRAWLMGRMQLLAVVSLPQKVFSGVGANAKTGIVFARRYTAEEEKANEGSRSKKRPAGALDDAKILLTTPNIDDPEWSLDAYLGGIIDSAKRIRKQERAKGGVA
jgi:hypothetical protein